MAPTTLAQSVESVLDRVYAGNTLHRWLIAGVVLLAGTLVLLLARRLVVLRMARIAERTATDLDDLAVDLVRRTAGFFLFALALFVARHWLELGETASVYVRRAIEVALLLQLGLWALGVVAFAVQRMTRGRDSDDPARTMGLPVLTFVGKVCIWSLVGVLCLQAVGQDINALIAGLGVGGIAIALAAQNILGDLFASITILLDKPFVVGDAIVLGDFQGTVENIGVKTTRLRSVSGEQIIIGNHDLVSSRVRNFKRLTERRQVFTIGITYDTPADKVAALPEILRQIVASVPDTRFDRAHFKSFGDSALLFEVVYFVKKSEFNALMDVQQRINLEIYRRFAAEGIAFAFPTQTVYQFTPGAQPAKAPAPG